MLGLLEFDRGEVARTVKRALPVDARLRDFLDGIPTMAGSITGTRRGDQDWTPVD